MLLTRIIRNFFSLLTGRIVAKGLALVGFVMLARYLGVERFGVYGTVMAYLTFFAAMADFGMATVTTREVAQDYASSERYFTHVSVLRLLLTCGAYIVLVLVAGVAHLSNYPLHFIMICGLFLFPEAFRNLGISMLSGYERMDLVAVFEIISPFFRYLPFLVIIMMGLPFETAFTVLVISWTVLAGLGLLITRRYCLTGWFAPITTQKLREILQEAFPFGVLFILSEIYFRSDILMLSIMKGHTAVGFYNSAFKFIEISLFIPISIINVLLPVMSRSFVSDKTAYQRLYVQATRILAIGVLPVVIGVSFFSKEVILFVYNSEYLPSAPALSLLIWTLLFIFINAPVGNILATSKKMYAFLPYAIGNTLLNVVLNGLLIPRYSFVGASFTTVLTEITGFLTQLYFANRIIGGTPQILNTLWKLGIAGGVTSVLLYFTRPLLPLPVNLLLLLGTYTLSLFLLKAISKDDQQLFLRSLKQVSSRIIEQSTESTPPKE
jgi:O-antigen/teichoic acid export membrane protein